MLRLHILAIKSKGLQCCQNNFCNILSSQQSYPNFSVPKNPKKSKYNFYQKMNSIEWMAYEYEIPL